jgi:hypothetical protein
VQEEMFQNVVDGKRGAVFSSVAPWGDIIVGFLYGLVDVDRKKSAGVR